eukprot:359883-Chlamydomonas_euryale.AAC.3
MKLISSRPSRLYCAQCEDIYNLPQGGSIKLYKASKHLEARHARMYSEWFGKHVTANADAAIHSYVLRAAGPGVSARWF